MIATHIHNWSVWWRFSPLPFLFESFSLSEQQGVMAFTKHLIPGKSVSVQ